MSDRRTQLIEFLRQCNQNDLAFIRSFLEQSSTSIQSLCDEILLNIFSFLESASSIRNLMLTCRKFYNIASDHHLWKGFCHRKRYKPLVQIPQTHISMWKGVYMQNYLTWLNWKRGSFKLFKTSNPSKLGIALDDQQAFSVTAGQPGQLWDLKTGRMRARLNAGIITSCKFDQDTIVVGSLNATISVWDKNTSQLVRELHGHQGEVGSISKHGNQVISGSEDGTIRVWDITTGESHVLSGHVGSVCSVTVGDGLIVSGGSDATVRLWDLKELVQKTILTGHGSVVFCAETKHGYVCSGSQDKLVKVWRNGKCLRTLKGHKEAVICLQFDEHKIVSGSSDNHIKIWDLHSGRLLYSLMRHTAPVWSLHLSETKLISSSFDQSVLVWDFMHRPEEQVDH